MLFPVDNTEPSSRRLRPSDTAPVMPMWDRKTIKVSGLNPSTRKGTMKLFFTNKRSNGGPIESIDYDTGNNVAYVTFKDTGGKYFICFFTHSDMIFIHLAENSKQHYVINPITV